MNFRLGNQILIVRCKWEPGIVGQVTAIVRDEGKVKAKRLDLNLKRILVDQHLIEVHIKKRKQSHIYGYYTLDLCSGRDEIIHFKREKFKVGSPVMLRCGALTRTKHYGRFITEKVYTVIGHVEGCRNGDYYVRWNNARYFCNTKQYDGHDLEQHVLGEDLVSAVDIKDSDLENYTKIISL